MQARENRLLANTKAVRKVTVSGSVSMVACLRVCMDLPCAYRFVPLLLTDGER